MTTLSTLKSQIADDLARSDLTSQIADAITNAIEHFQRQPFFFQESRTDTFTTTADQSTYDSDDDSSIPLWVKFDSVWLEDSNSETYWLTRNSASQLEPLLDNSAASGRPYNYAYFGNAFRFYPIPDGTYTVRPVGIIKKAAPATDDETGNYWMNDARELIRCRAKWYIYGHIIQQYDKAAVMGGREGEGGAVGAALDSLREEGMGKMSMGGIQKTDF